MNAAAYAFSRLKALLLSLRVFATLGAVASAAWRRLAGNVRDEIVFFHVERVEVGVPVSAASFFVRDVANLPLYEQKVHASRLLPTRPDVPPPLVAYELAGGWCGVPWTGAFSMRRTKNGGFHSRGIPLRPGQRGVTASVMRIHGGFVLRSTARGTVVVHYESYRWHPSFALLRLPSVHGLVARWHRDGMRVEMQSIKAAMEASVCTGSARPPAALAQELREGHLNIGRFATQELTGKRYQLELSPVAGAVG